MTSTDTASELRAAADKIRDLATRTATTLERHETDWTDLTVTGGPGRVSPMVWSQHAAALGPVAGLALAGWLDHAADTLLVGRIHGTGLVICDPCCEELPCQHIKPALAVARAINGTVSGAAL